MRIYRRFLDLEDGQIHYREAGLENIGEGADASCFTGILEAVRAINREVG